MNPKCVQAVNSARVAAGGNPMTAAQIANIDARMSRTMRQLARQDPQTWMATPLDQRMLLAAQQAMADIKAEAQRKVDNANRQALKTAEVENRVTANRTRLRSDRSHALVEDFNQSHAYIDGIKRDYTRNLMDLIDAAKSGEGASPSRRVAMALFDAQNPQMTRDLAMEVFAKGNGNTGNALARQGAKAWLDVTDAMRQRFNAAGGDVGKLDYGYLPQAHDQLRVLKMGRDGWANKTLPMLDRSRYLNEDGSRMTDAQVLDLLRNAWDTISSDGQNKTAPGAFKGTGAKANKGSESREIHFKDGDSYLAYMRDFGTGSMYDAMIGHVGGLARDIGLVERYGPNPEAQMRVQFDLADRADGGPQRVFANRPQAYWSILSGASGQPVSAKVALIGQDIRNIETFGKLQGAVLSSLTDLGTYFVTTGFNKLSYWDAFTNIGGAMAKDTKDFMNAHGMIAESMISDLNRWSGENIRQNWSGRVTNSTMRLSLMNAWTDTLRRAFSLTMMQGLGKMRSKTWAQLTEYDRWRMESKGLTEADWQLIQNAQPVQHRGADIITPDSIYATGDPRAGEVVAKYLGLISDESEVAILNPDLATRAITTAGGTRRGTIDGELWRAVAQFKSFPIAMISRHWRRMLDTPQGMQGAPAVANRLVYFGALMTSLTALGAVAFQTKQIVSGKDPVDMTTPKFWTRAFAQGGGAGFMGDILLQDTTDDRGPLDTFSKMTLGPAYGSAADLFELTKGNFDEWNAGKQTHAWAEAARFVRGHAPLVNLWYAKAAIDHAGMQALQENLSPGYLARIQNKAQKDWGQEFWWRPGESTPERAPDFAEVAP